MNTMSIKDRKVRGRFSVEKLRKRLFVLMAQLLKPPRAWEQKFFAELFYKKATAYFLKGPAMLTPNTATALIRKASTILILRDSPLEVLMVKRHAKAFFGSALVFPGGAEEPADAAPDWLPYCQGAEGMAEPERAARIAGIREVFEETAILLATPDAAPAAGADFFQTIRASGAKLMLDALVPFAHWVTPDYVSKRFDTRFYVCHAPAGCEAVADGGETESLEWIAPGQALALAAAGERLMAFPTKLNLQRLAESADAAGALAAARLRPEYVVRPWIETTDAGQFVHIPAEAGYAVTMEPAVPH